MIKKLPLLLVACGLLTGGGSLQSQQTDVNIVRTYKFEKSYVFKEEALLISETDLYCSFFIGFLNSEYRVIESAEPDTLRDIFSDFDKLYITRRAGDELEEGDRFLLVGRGNVIKHPFTGRILGNLYVKKNLCRVTCVFEDRAIVELGQVGNPVEKGDYLIPYIEEETVFEKMPDYKSCKIPEAQFSGDVVFIGEYIDAEGSPIQRDLAAMGRYLSVDLGKEFLQKGDFLLFYYQVREDLPPIIVGLGIVISTHNLTSTVKVLDSSSDIYIRRPEVLNTKVVLLDIPQEEEPVEPVAEPTPSREPVVEQQIVEEDRYQADIYYAIDAVKPKEPPSAVLENIRDMLRDKEEYLITLKGYACTIGRTEYNLELSQKRVEHLKQLLIDELGVSGEAVQTYYYGEEESEFDNTTEEERRKNRRVTVEVRAR